MNNYTAIHGDEGFAAPQLADSLSLLQPYMLTQLHFGYHGVRDPHWPPLEALLRYTRLASLALEGRGQPTAGAVLSQLRQLSTLIYHMDHFTPDAMEGILQLSRLTELDLSADSSALPLAQQLTRLSRLVSLTLGDGEGPDDGDAVGVDEQGMEAVEAGAPLPPNTFPAPADFPRLARFEYDILGAYGNLKVRRGQGADS